MSTGTVCWSEVDTGSCEAAFTDWHKNEKADFRAKWLHHCLAGKDDDTVAAQDQCKLKFKTRKTSQ